MTDRWEYLVSYPYTVRHRIAEHFVAEHKHVVDVGTYKLTLKPSPEQTVTCIDPLQTVEGFDGSFSQWWEHHNTFTGFALVILGCAIEGSRHEWDCVTQAAKQADMIVLEWATDYVSPFGDPSLLMVGYNTLFHSRMVFPHLGTPGFKEYNNRIMMVGTK